jgi:hypothetical protein
LFLKARKFLSLVLLALFASASTANALPLVLCVGSYGHSAIKLKVGNSDCQEFIRTLGGPETTAAASQAGDCVDFSLSQVASVRSEPSPTATSIATDGSLAVLPFVISVNYPATALRIFQPAFIADQLKQLRSVVLII